MISNDFYIYRFIFLVRDKLYACCIYWCDSFFWSPEIWDVKKFQIDDKKYYTRTSDRGWWCWYASTHEKYHSHQNHFEMKSNIRFCLELDLLLSKYLSLKSKQNYANLCSCCIFDEVQINMKNIFKWNVRKTKCVKIRRNCICDVV